MKIVSEFVDGPVLPVPDNLEGMIASVADCGLTPREMAFCYSGLRDLGEYVKTHPLPPSIGCCILFSDKDEITLAEEEECLLGEALSLAVIQLGRIRRAGPGYEKWLRFVLLEEVCHILYAIRNEYRVKEIVAEVLSLNPDAHVNLHEFFPDHFDETGHRIPLPEYPLEWAREPADGALAPAVSARLPHAPGVSAPAGAPGVCESKAPDDASAPPGTPGICESKAPDHPPASGGTPGICESRVPEALPIPEPGSPKDKKCRKTCRPGASVTPSDIVPGVCRTASHTVSRSGSPRPVALSPNQEPVMAPLPPQKSYDNRETAPKIIPGVCRTVIRRIIKK